MTGSQLPRPCWMAVDGPHHAVALTTRCRVARNVDGLPFPWRASAADRKRAAEAVLDAAQRAGGGFSNALCWTAEALGPDASERSVEWRYASPGWAAGGPHRHLIVFRDGSGSAMVNEEDHLRLSIIGSGLQVESCLDEAEAAAAALARSVRFAHDGRLGFLTASPANAGSGVRTSVLMHLPGMAARGRLARYLRAADDLGCSVRGVYGEGSFGTGWFVQVSTTRAMGLAAPDAASRVASAARHLVGEEMRARAEIYGSPSGRAALGTAVRNCMSALFETEAEPGVLLDIVSTLRLAAAEGLLAVPLPSISEWIAVAGLTAAVPGRPEASSRHFESVRRSAEMRARLRALLGSSGTSGAGGTK